MKLYAPKYYKDFVCIADRCRHSCCVGWEIDVDGETAEKYAALGEGYGKKIRESIDTDGTPHFRLAENDRCPHLSSSGLCNIITELGENYLCEICREHPRFYNDSPRGKEVGLGMACEEACRIILGSDGYADIVEIGELDGDAIDSALDTVALREALYSILSDVSLTYAEKLHLIYEKYDVSPALLSDEESGELLSSLEYLDATHKELFSSYSASLYTSRELEKPLERALAYFIYRHLTEASDENECRASLCLCLFCERLLASVALAENIRDIEGFAELARIVSEEIEYSEDNTEAIRLAYSLK